MTKSIRYLVYVTNKNALWINIPQFGLFLRRWRRFDNENVFFYALIRGLVYGGRMLCVWYVVFFFRIVNRIHDARLNGFGDHITWLEVSRPNCASNKQTNTYRHKRPTHLKKLKNKYYFGCLSNIIGLNSSTGIIFSNGFCFKNFLVPLKQNNNKKMK